MKIKTKMLVDRLAAIISAWPLVECISLNEAALPDTLDPYFALILDIYYDKAAAGSAEGTAGAAIPGPEERARLYGSDCAAFESSGDQSKDRFLVGDLPVHLEYKPLAVIEERVVIAESRPDSFSLIKDSGTYGFYRLARGELIFSRGSWMRGIRSRIDALGDGFWELMRNAAQSRMEHFLSDLGAAAIHGDEFNCLISSAGFIKNACLTLFCINRCFEPSHRAYRAQVLALPVLPESFNATFMMFLNQSHGPELKRQYDLAKLIARGIVVL